MKKRVLLVNGINTHQGGAGAQTLGLWTRTLSRKCEPRTFHLTPGPLSSGSRALHKAYLAAIFFPGTLFRVFRNPVFELLFKVSLLQWVRFLREQRRSRPDQVVLSHHAAFFLAASVPRSRRVLLIHDLLYVRAKSMGYSRAITRAVFGVELWVCRSAPRILVHSLPEKRLLSRFLGGSASVRLVSSCEFSQTLRASSSGGAQQSLALIADWRRFENVEGVRAFFLSKPSKISQNNSHFSINIWGFNAEAIGRILSEVRIPWLHFETRGSFSDYSEVRDPLIFVPIFIGAGIKIKVLEALAHGKGVVGTKAAFIGIPRSILKGVSTRIETLDDLRTLKLAPPSDEEFRIFARGYSAIFEDIDIALQV